MPDTERATTTADRLREMMRDTMTLMLGAASWATEEGERLVRQWMDRGEVSREEGKKMLEQLRTQYPKSPYLAQVPDFKDLKPGEVGK